MLSAELGSLSRRIDDACLGAIFDVVPAWSHELRAIYFFPKRVEVDKGKAPV
jgi:DNA-directed RNA polymerase subunit F